MQKREVPMSEQMAEITDSIVVKLTGNKLQIKNASLGMTLNIFSSMGIQALTIPLDSSDKTVLLKLPKGFYYYKIGVRVGKIVIL